MFKVGDTVRVDSPWLPSGVLNFSHGTLIKPENYPTAGWVVEFNNGKRGTFEESELTLIPIVTKSNLTQSSLGSMANLPYDPPLTYEVNFCNTKEEDIKEEESEGDALMRFFKTPIKEWKGYKK